MPIRKFEFLIFNFANSRSFHRVLAKFRSKTKTQSTLLGRVRNDFSATESKFEFREFVFRVRQKIANSASSSSLPRPGRNFA